jgi:HSP20 family protein
MNLVKWKPAKELLLLNRRLHNLLDDDFFRFPAFFSDEEKMWAPVVDIYEDEKEIVLKAELPEVDPKDVDIKLEDGYLILKGERKFDKEVKKENFYRLERSYGSFKRQFNLPSYVDKDKVKASYKDGVLKIQLPKKEEAKSTKVDIKVS